MSRPYFDDSFYDLEKLFNSSKDDPRVLKTLLNELNHRSTDFARTLRKKVEDRLKKLEDDETNFKGSMKAALQGVAEAQCWVGIMYDQGEGVEQDHEQAFEWFMKAAKQQDHANAQLAIGRMYQFGQGTDKDPEEALEWYSKSKEKGNDLASALKINLERELKECDQITKKYRAEKNEMLEQESIKLAIESKFLSNYNLDQDYIFTTHFFKVLDDSLVLEKDEGSGYRFKEIETDNEYILERIDEIKDIITKLSGLSFDQGEQEEDEFTLTMAEAKKGDAYAQCNLGTMYAEGLGVPQNYEEAVKWFLLAAEQRHEQAPFNLEMMHGNSPN